MVAGAGHGARHQSSSVTPLRRASTSFTESEIRLACQILTRMMSNGGRSTLVTHSDFRNVARKFQAMKQKLEDTA